MNNLEKIAEIREAIEKATGNGKWNIGKASPNGLQNIGHKGLMICQVFEVSDAHLIANAAEYINSPLSELEETQAELLKARSR